MELEALHVRCSALKFRRAVLDGAGLRTDRVPTAALVAPLFGVSGSIVASQDHVFREEDGLFWRALRCSSDVASDIALELATMADRIELPPDFDTALETARQFVDNQQDLALIVRHASSRDIVGSLIFATGDVPEEKARDNCFRIFVDDDAVDADDDDDGTSFSSSRSIKRVRSRRLSGSQHAIESSLKLDELLEKKKRLATVSNRKLADEVASKRRIVEQDRVSTTRVKRREIWDLESRIRRARGGVRVVGRVRPSNDEKSVVSCDRERNIVTIDLFGHPQFKGCYETVHDIELDEVFDHGTSQEQIFDRVEHLVDDVRRGASAIVMAFGCTGSGKTYTLVGDDPHQPGVAFRAVDQLLPNSEVVVSMLEIHNEEVFDLLRDEKPAPIQQPKRRGSMKIHLTKDDKRPYAAGQCHRVVGSLEEFRRVMDLGCRRRATAATKLNAHSSRSHVILEIAVESGGRLWICDLAGSERVSTSGAEGDKLKEAAFINKSLSTLGDVFEAIDRQRPHVPYRNSKLTHLMQNILEDPTSQCLFIVAASPHYETAPETFAALSFAQRVRAVTLWPDDPDNIKAQKQACLDAIFAALSDQEEFHLLTRQLHDLDDVLASSSPQHQSTSEEEEVPRLALSSFATTPTRRGRTDHGEDTVSSPTTVRTAERELALEVEQPTTVRTAERELALEVDELWRGLIAAQHDTATLRRELSKETTRPPPKVSYEFDEVPHKLLVTVHGARDLVILERESYLTHFFRLLACGGGNAGGCTPFVVVKCGDVVATTGAADGTTSPTWDHDFVFEDSGPPIISYVFADFYPHRLCLLGKLVLHVDQVQSSSSSSVHLDPTWFPLEPCDDIDAQCIRGLKHPALAGAHLEMSPWFFDTRCQDRLGTVLVSIQSLAEI